jgi:hypothetical protein
VTKYSWRWSVLGAVVAMMAALGMRCTDYPLLGRLPGGTWLLVSSDCPASVRAFLSIRESTELRRDVLIVPADSTDSDVRRWACDTLHVQLGERGSWLRYLPADMVCEAVSREAGLFREFNFIVSPAWAVDMVPSPVNWAPPGPGLDQNEARR